MSTKEIKAKIRKRVDQIENGVAEGMSSLGDDVEASGDQPDEPQETLRDVGRRILDTTKGLGDEATRQARLHPLAVFGVAFVAGIIVARALRR